jgi:HK97 family phage major capsid protein
VFPDYRKEILSTVLGPESLVSRCFVVPTTSTRVLLPRDDDQNFADSDVVTGAGIEADWYAEGAAMSGGKPNLGQVIVDIHKTGALVKVSDEMLDDAPMLGAYLQQKIPEKIGMKVTRAILTGLVASTTTPRGVYTAACAVTVAKEGGQANGSIVVANLLKMWAAMPAERRAGAVWVINHNLETLLPTLVIGQMPVYLPAGGLSGSPTATLFGRPVISSLWAPAVGEAGDIALIDFSAYLVAMRGAIKSDVSIHLAFDQAKTAFRATMRLGGGPIFSAPITLPDSTTVSPFVLLGARKT